MEVLGPFTYQLRLPPQWKIHDIFHATLLMPYHETEAHGPNFAYPPPDTIEGEEQWEVEAITHHKKYRRKVKGKPQCYKFLVKWKGCPTSAPHGSRRKTWRVLKRSLQSIKSYTNFVASTSTAYTTSTYAALNLQLPSCQYVQLHSVHQR